MPIGFRFTPLQSELTATILRRHGIDREAILKGNTVYLVLSAGTEHERLLTKSNVTVNMLLVLGWTMAGTGILAEGCALFCAQRGVQHIRALSLPAHRQIRSLPFADRCRTNGIYQLRVHAICSIESRRKPARRGR